MSNVKGRGHCQSCQTRHLSIFAQLPQDKLVEVQAFQPSVLAYAAAEAVYYQGDYLIRWCESSNGGWVALSFSRFLSDWKRQGFLNEQRGNIQLESVEGLRKAVCSCGSC